MFRRVLVSIDFAPSSLRALALARTHFPQAERLLLHVLDERAVSVADVTTGGVAPVKPPEDLQQAFGREDEGRLLALAQEGEAYQLIRGDPVQGILRAARDWNADLIVMGTHGRSGLMRVFMGSVAERVVREADVPVLTLRDPHHEG